MPRYSVKQVAALTGVPSATLRAWERRYAVVAPERTESRYRLYDDADVARLQEMARLVEAGTPASLAAAQVVAGMGGGRRHEVERPTVGAPDEPGAEAAQEAAGAGSHHGPAVTDLAPPTAADLVQAARTFDQELLDHVLDRAFARASFEHVVDGWLMHALEAVGRAWMVGSVSVSGEHFVSAVVLSRLSRAFAAAGIHRGAPVALVGLPPGARHELGTVAFATCLRRQGVDVRYLGADVPRESWREAVEQLSPAAVVLTVSMRPDVSSAEEVVADLLSLDAPPAVFVGGGSVEEMDLPEGVVPLPHTLSVAALEVAEALHG